MTGFFLFFCAIRSEKLINFYQENELIKVNPIMSTKVIIKTSRFVFSEDTVELLSEFAKLHHDDERKAYKAAWQEWIEESDVKPILDTETDRLQSLGFKGDVLDKMFKSVRYYFRKKNSATSEESESKSPRTYNTLPRETLKKIDEHIKEQIKTHLHINNNAQVIESAVKPSTCFDDFCIINKPLFLEMLEGETATNERMNQIVERLKKTYKNRYYNIKVSIESQ